MTPCANVFVSFEDQLSLKLDLKKCSSVVWWFNDVKNTSATSAFKTLENIYFYSQLYRVVCTVAGFECMWSTYDAAMHGNVRLCDPCDKQLATWAHSSYSTVSICCCLSMHNIKCASLTICAHTGEDYLTFQAIKKIYSCSIITSWYCTVIYGALDLSPLRCNDIESARALDNQFLSKAILKVL